MESLESPYHFQRHATHGIVSLNPLINEGQWGTVMEVGNEILVDLESLPVQALVVDLSPLTHICSPQLSLLVRLWKSLKQRQGRMSVQCPGEVVRDVLLTANLRSLWQIVETREQALEAIGVARVRRVDPIGWIRLATHWLSTPRRPAEQVKVRQALQPE